MRLRIGLATGFAVGYYLGSRAGRERFEQINDVIRRFMESPQVETATERAKEVIGSGIDRAREMVESRAGNGLHNTETGVPGETPYGL